MTISPYAPEITTAHPDQGMWGVADFVLILNHTLGMLQGGRLRGAPDLIIEVESPGHTPTQMHEKHRLYARLGMPEDGVVNPATRTLAYHRLEAATPYSTPQHFGAGDTVRSACLPSIPLAVADLFAHAPETTIQLP